MEGYLADPVSTTMH